MGPEHVDNRHTDILPEQLREELHFHISSPIAMLSNGAIIQPAATIEKGFAEMNLYLYDIPAPNTPAERV